MAWALGRAQYPPPARTPLEQGGVESSVVLYCLEQHAEPGMQNPENVLKTLAIRGRNGDNAGMWAGHSRHVCETFHHSYVDGRVSGLEQGWWE